MSLESPITPTVGRIVLVRGAAVVGTDPAREVPAIVTRVWGQNCINVRVFRDDYDGGDLGLTSLTFNDDVADRSSHANWRWMPYQIAKATV